ncbi:hypothetical protein ECANGB1_36 [Enterospora canceri]|uniref:General transcription and DNA repair factor IIH subunit TFB5 n=1 Tax=Enterospora canceri TaxID=1081671 RepID=A0A1Y1S8F8_9MICR|nr:hypothetical protein ECANGB1_36 [Enterospora canceri]
MVRERKCVMIKTEPSIKEVIGTIAENKKFLIHDMDDNYIFITEQGAKNIEQKVKNVMRGTHDKFM